MDRIKSLGNRLAVSSSLPSESFLKNPVIEVFGCRRVFVENHKGIAEYGCCKITVNVSYGQICVSGERLELAEMTKASLVITGIIESVNLIRKQGDAL